jgi:hypothetical protein
MLFGHPPTPKTALVSEGRNKKAALGSEKKGEGANQTIWPFEVARLYCTGCGGNLWEGKAFIIMSYECYGGGNSRERAIIICFLLYFNSKVWPIAVGGLS